ncbi:hypothetical protein Xen7305DRAFT_00012200 [Xenococcus sp. PCC 7305]|uniref:YdcF family protein n=1 Tax=Xenococcus sp. PCC 7305 TaxID=102125 RepID=UPI0002AC3ABD|nr:YdcF family protein [Xenococcus sp. PCC 7305]ELS01516.1 hypothetical protein Xen7305DRAFT_00012200 [Xenococcus sp. PCC 7305]
MNFLFLSKLLPLFVYPLGLACILLIVALVLSFKRSKYSYIPILLALVIFLIAGNSRVSHSLLKSLEWQYLSDQELPTADAIVVLGGSVHSVAYPRTLPDLNEHGDRVIYAAKLYNDGKAPLILLSGGRIDWYGDGSSEAQDTTKILELMGIPSSAMIQEGESVNTYENAIFTQKILEEQGLKKIILITSAFHMPRSLKIFQHLGIDAVPAPTDFYVSQQELREADHSAESKILSFIPNTKSLDRTTMVIKEYIGTIVYWLRGWL